MSIVDVRLSFTPALASITGLVNTTFDEDNVRADRGASEGQVAALNAALAAALERMDEIINSDDGMLQALWDRLQTLAEQIEACCTEDHGSAALTELWAKLDALDAQIAACANPTQATTGDGTAVTVTFTWNGDGSDPVADGGQATAVSADANRTIVGYWFLARDANTGLYYRAHAVYGGDYSWRIDLTTGAVTAVPANGADVPYSNVIVAADDVGNEGATAVTLPVILEQAQP